ncbi:MAG: elongation factor P [Eubacteriales bacterium]|nr:elongation factor P [Eubacteriales bacterium]
MISAGDFRNGTTFEMDGDVFQIVEFQHVKPGKGSAFVRAKYKNVRTGSTVEHSFNPSEKFEEARLERHDMSYIYQDGDLYYFMDLETYEQTPFSKDVVGEAMRFVKENDTCKVVSYKGKVFEVEPATFVTLEVTDTEPGVRGDTATNVSKNATLETGATIKVPLFVNNGDLIRVDTRSGEYVDRA